MKEEKKHVKKVKMVTKTVLEPKVKMETKKVLKKAIRMVKKKVIERKPVIKENKIAQTCSCYQQACGCLGVADCMCSWPKCSCAPQIHARSTGHRLRCTETL